MTIYQLILLQVIAHFIADFTLQSEVVCAKKEKHIFTKDHLIHALIVTITAYLFSFDFYFGLVALCIGISHFAIDVFKSFFVQKYADKKAIIFFYDQLLHIAIIIFLCWYYFKNYNQYHLFDFKLSLKSLSIFTAFLFCSKPANIFIKNLFDLFNLNIPKEDSTEKDLENAGKIIGIMERFMTLALIFSSQFAAVGLIIAAKSILRFNNPQKNEYILVGTLLSFGFAILLGVLINQL